MKSSTTDGIRPRFPKMEESQGVDRGPGSCRHSYCAKHSTDDDANTSTSMNCRWTITEACIQFDKWRKMPDNATQYCPSVSTISHIKSKDEGTLPYALKRIQRDFPFEWKHHPFGPSHDEIYWHKHRLRFFGKTLRGKREPSATISLSGIVRSMFGGAVRSKKGEQTSTKKVRRDDEASVTPKYRPVSFINDDSDGEEEHRRLRARYVSHWLG